MEIVDLFMEKSKDKFLNMLIKIPKAYDWYLGIVIKLDDYDLARLDPIDDFLTRRCEEIYNKFPCFSSIAFFKSLGTNILSSF